MKFKPSLVVFFILLAIWLILNNSLHWQIVVSGVALSLFLALVFCRNCPVFDDINLTPKAFLYTFLYLGAFFTELVKSNIDIARRVLSPSLPIQPGIVRAQTRLKSKMARLILANSITLTPGTFTIDIIDDTLYIHCVHIDGENTEEYARSVVRKLEKYLEVLYG